MGLPEFVLAAVVTVSLLVVMPVAGEPGENCARQCVPGEPARVCEWTFEVEWFLTMSKACFGCPCNLADCDRPHCITGDGNHRALISVNRQYPGPTIEVCEGDTVKVLVHNKMVNGESITIHWHGQHQKGNPYMDGTDMVTQCPITERSKFQYEFTAGPTGTHIYHAHTGIQMSDGQLGALIVHSYYDPHYDLYDHDCATPSGDCEFVLAVQDWMTEPYLARWATEEFAGRESHPSSLINGRMNRFCHESDNGQCCPPLFTFNVEQGKKYRFRLLVEGAGKGGYKVSIEGHSMLVIAMDGHDVEPVAVDALSAGSGERYDFILDAANHKDNYWVKAHHTHSDVNDRPNAYAILRYNGAQIKDPSGNPDKDQDTGSFLQPVLGKVDDSDLIYSHGEGFDINVDELRSVKGEDFTNEVVDNKKFLTLSMIYNDNSRFQHKEYYPLSALAEDLRTPSAVIDNITFLIPPFAALPQLDDTVGAYLAGLLCNEDTINHEDCIDDLCYCVHFHLIAKDQVQEFIVLNDGPVPHPMHMHGYAFRVLGIGRVGEGINKDLIKQMDANGELKRNFVDAPYRDTIVVPDRSYVVLRFKADNPGMWLFHCHLTDHIDLSQILLMVVGDVVPPVTGTGADRVPVPPNFPTCGDWVP